MKLEELLPFCSTDETRFQLTSPFNQGGSSCASDGAIFIAVPEIPGVREYNPGPNKLGVNRIIPDPAGYKPVEYPLGWENFPEKTIPCSACNGTGRLNKCRSCKGTGSIECGECGHESSCDDCRGKGSYTNYDPLFALEPLPCENCEGEGKIDLDLPVVVFLNHGAVTVDKRYLKLALTLPGMRISFLNDMAALRLDFDGGKGALMPLRFSESASQIPIQWPHQPDN